MYIWCLMNMNSFHQKPWRLQEFAPISTLWSSVEKKLSIWEWDCTPSMLFASTRCCPVLEPIGIDNLSVYTNDNWNPKCIKHVVFYVSLHILLKNIPLQIKNTAHAINYYLWIIIKLRLFERFYLYFKAIGKKPLPCA